MDWIFQHLWTLVIIAGVIVKVLQAIRGQKSGGTTQHNEPPQPKEYEFEDPELAERTRKIREEIQRKIEERRGQHMRPSAPVAETEPPRIGPQDRSPEATQPPLTLPQVIREVLQPKPVVVSQTRMEEMREAEEAERQAALAEQLQEAERMQAAAQRRAAFEEATADVGLRTRQATQASVLEDLRDPAALRRAFILREVLGPPVALR
ncbi:MAG TPA: hypothetical protein VFJ90_04530 [Candidatus Didemnitutus sp.]|nr:hypothetical protein [Candidatus Didemnitutus sp.]